MGRQINFKHETVPAFIQTPTNQIDRALAYPLPAPVTN